MYVVVQGRNTTANTSTLFASTSMARLSRCASMLTAPTSTTMWKRRRRSMALRASKRSLPWLQSHLRSILSIGLAKATLYENKSGQGYSKMVGRISHDFVSHVWPSQCLLFDTQPLGPKGAQDWLIHLADRQCILKSKRKITFIILRMSTCKKALFRDDLCLRETNRILRIEPRAADIAKSF